MNKTLICLAVAFMAMTSSNAQTDKRIFNHLAIGLNVGTTGIGADIAVPCTKFVDIQAGFMIMPKISYSTAIHPNVSSFIKYDNTAVSQQITENLNLDEIPIRGKLNMVNGKILINAYPIPKSSFHITVGAYFGKSDIIEVYNTTPGQLDVIDKANALIEEANSKFDGVEGYKHQDPIGVKIGDYLLEPKDGNVSATLKTNGFKPYVGLGVGRAVPGRTRLNFKFDIGAMFWGTPDVVDHNGESLMKHDLDGKDGGAFRIISKVKVYPVLNFRLAGRIF